MKRRALVVCLLVTGGLAAVAGAASWANVVGSYTAVVTRQAAPLNGSWTLKFKTTYGPAGTFQSFRNGRLVVSGNTAFTGDKVTVVDMSGSYACKGTQKAAVYTFKLSGKSLRFVPVVDLCSGRKALLANRAFTKK